MPEAKLIQKERVSKIVAHMEGLLSDWVRGETEAFLTKMHAYAKDLSTCSFGDQLLEVIANVYEIQAKRALGGLTGFGAGLKMTKQKMKSRVKVMGAAMRVMQAHFEIKKVNEEDKKLALEGRGEGGEEESGVGGQPSSSSASPMTAAAARAGSTASATGKKKAKLEEMALPLMLEAMWAANVVDIEDTVALACKQLLGKKVENKKEKALGLLKLGEVFQAAGVAVSHGKGGLSKAQDARQKMQDALFKFQMQKRMDEDEDPPGDPNEID